MKVFVPVPYVATKAVDESALPRVVVTLDPPDITIDRFTVTNIVVWAINPTESVAVIVSKYVVVVVSNPRVDDAFTTPVVALIVIPETVGEIL